MNYNTMSKDELIRELQQKDEELEKSRQTENFLNDIINKNPIPIQICDEEGFTIKANKAHKRLFQAKPPVTYSIFSDPQFKRQGLDETFNNLKSGKVIRIENSTYNAHEVDPKFPNKKLWIRSVGFPIFDNGRKPERYVLMLEDFTDRKLAEIKMEELNKKLLQTKEYQIQAREHERKSIAREIHDEFGQILLAAKMQIKNVKNKIDDQNIVSEIDAALDVMKDTTQTLNRIISGLDPLFNSELRIDEIIKSYCKDFAERYKLEFYTDIDQISGLSSKARLILFRILQASLTNIVLHSQAAKVDIWLTKNNKKIELMISDNGIGIPKKVIKSEKSFGINSMRDRASSIGGKFSIKCGSDFGTIVKVIIPTLNK
jgi:signal transduction histidine kinase